MSGTTATALEATGSKAPRVFISVAEDSADLHAACLVRAARRHLPGCEFYGLTGPRLRVLGVQTVFDLASHAAMLSGAIGLLGRAWKAIRQVERCWRKDRPDLVVLLDSPELHLRLARRAKRLGLPVLYYIAPQTWAARQGRNRQIARDVDHLACILPFEEEYFRQFGVQADYVGHPLFESLRQAPPRAEVVEGLRWRARGRPIVALLPGSRRHVISAMLPRQLEVLRRLQAAGKPVYAAISCASEARRPQIAGLVAESLPAREGSAPAVDPSADIIVDDNASLLTAADLALVASGTATLLVAAYRRPMVVMYDAGGWLRLPYRLFGRLVVRLPHLSLVNVLAGARVVPEFMPFVRDLDAVAAVVGQLLVDSAWRSLMVRQLDELVRPLENLEASARVCRMMARMLGLDGTAGPRGPSAACSSQALTES